jgi:hypothetical protein
MPRPTPILLTVLLALAGTAGRGNDLRCEWFNRSGRTWRLALVEGVRAPAGRLRIIDKFTGRTVTVLGRPGETLDLPPGARFLVEWQGDLATFFQDLILTDGAGSYAEYVLDQRYRSDPTPVLSYKDRHVGPPLNRAAEEAVLRGIQDAIAITNGSLLIRQDFIGPRADP